MALLSFSLFNSIPTAYSYKSVPGNREAIGLEHEYLCSTLANHLELSYWCLLGKGISIWITLEERVFSPRVKAGEECRECCYPPRPIGLGGLHMFKGQSWVKVWSCPVWNGGSHTQAGIPGSLLKGVMNSCEQLEPLRGLETRLENP